MEKVKSGITKHGEEILEMNMKLLIGLLALGVIILAACLVLMFAGLP